MTKKANFLTFCCSMAQSVSLPIPLLITPLTHSNSLKLILFDLFLTQFYLFLLIFLTYLLFCCFYWFCCCCFFFVEVFRSTILLLIRNLDNPLLISFNCISILFLMIDVLFYLLICVLFCIPLFLSLFVCLFFSPSFYIYDCIWDCQSICVISNL